MWVIMSTNVCPTEILRSRSDFLVVQAFLPASGDVLIDPIRQEAPGKVCSAGAGNPPGE
jgi:hypothetical protein